MTNLKLNLYMLSEDCIWMSDAFPRSLEDDGHKAAAWQIRKMAERYRVLLDALFEQGYDPFNQEPAP